MVALTTSSDAGPLETAARRIYDVLQVIIEDPLITREEFMTRFKNVSGEEEEGSLLAEDVWDRVPDPDAKRTVTEWCAMDCRGKYRGHMGQKNQRRMEIFCLPSRLEKLASKLPKPGDVAKLLDSLDGSRCDEWHRLRNSVPDSSPPYDNLCKIQSIVDIIAEPWVRPLHELLRVVLDGKLQMRTETTLQPRARVDRSGLCHVPVLQLRRDSFVGRASSPAAVDVEKLYAVIPWHVSFLARCAQEVYQRPGDCAGGSFRKSDHSICFPVSD